MQTSKRTSGHPPQALHDVGDGKARLGHLPGFLHDRIGRARLEFAQLVRVLTQLFQILPALLHRAGRKVILADSDDACDDRYDLCDVLAEGRWGGWTADSIDDVLDRYHDGVGLCFEIGLEARNRSAIRGAADSSKMYHL